MVGIGDTVRVIDSPEVYDISPELPGQEAIVSDVINGQVELEIDDPDDALGMPDVVRLPMNCVEKVAVAAHTFNPGETAKDLDGDECTVVGRDEDGMIEVEYPDGRRNSTGGYHAWDEDDLTFVKTAGVMFERSIGIGQTGDGKYIELKEQQLSNGKTQFTLQVDGGQTQKFTEDQKDKAIAAFQALEDPMMVEGSVRKAEEDDDEEEEDEESSWGVEPQTDFTMENKWNAMSPAERKTALIESYKKAGQWDYFVKYREQTNQPVDEYLDRLSSYDWPMVRDQGGNFWNTFKAYGSKRKADQSFSVGDQVVYQFPEGGEVYDFGHDARIPNGTVGVVTDVRGINVPDGPETDNKWSKGQMVQIRWQGLDDSELNQQYRSTSFLQKTGSRKRTAAQDGNGAPVTDGDPITYRGKKGTVDWIQYYPEGSKAAVTLEDGWQGEVFTYQLTKG